MTLAADKTRPFKSRSTTVRKPRRNRSLMLSIYGCRCYLRIDNKGGCINNSVQNRTCRSHPCYLEVASRRSVHVFSTAREGLRLVTFIYDTSFILSTLLSTHARSPDASSVAEMNAMLSTTGAFQIYMTTAQSPFAGMRDAQAIFISYSIIFV